MSQKVSRRVLAKTIAAKLAAGESTSHLARSVAAFLLEYKMTDQLEMLIRDIAYELSESGRHLLVTVSSAHELSASLRADIARYFKDRYEVAQVETDEVTDTDLIGGVVITTPDEALDLSIRAKLKRLQQA